MFDWSLIIFAALWSFGFVVFGKGLLGTIVGTVLAMTVYILLCIKTNRDNPVNEEELLKEKEDFTDTR